MLFKYYYHKCSECGDNHTLVLLWPGMLLIGIIIGALFFFPLGMKYQECKQKSAIIDEWDEVDNGN